MILNQTTKLKHRQNRSAYLWAILILACGGYLLFLNSLTVKTNTLLDIAEQNAKMASITYTKSISVGNNKRAIVLMKHDPFRVGSRWTYVSKKSPLPKKFVPADLQPVTVSHSKSEKKMQLTQTANVALSKLFRAAKRQGISLIVASAYRSIDDQQKLLDSYVNRIGFAAAKRQVAAPGTSEHHTGLAADVDSASEACEIAASDCSLTQSDALWLAKNAPRYGFIIRYPDNGEAETGIRYEPWHLRYIGSDAPSFASLNTTLDQFVKQYH